MNPSLTVLVLDDNPRTALGSLNYHLAAVPGDPQRFELRSLPDPAKLDGYLSAHPDQIDVVLVDVEFELTSTKTCLTAFQALIGRANGPKAIGLSGSQHGRTLFPFAVCQLLPPPQRQTLVGWTYKDDKPGRGYPELVRILDALASNRRMGTPSTLEACLPDGDKPETSQFMHQILAGRTDARLWHMMSRTHYEAKELASGTSSSISAVRKRFKKYTKAIEEFQNAMHHDVIHPPGGKAVAERPRGERQDPVKEIVEVFAQEHRTFFQAPELEDIVVRRDNWLSRRRNSRRQPDGWWKPEP
ncbi:hypothetical protein [Streptomyces sp. NPDC059712]|uniref:hypothetical protein n=1 Tax=Streptomyces sp. NPDC059712 TaxID=3346919 RepID=UPI0036ACFA97